MTAPTITVLIPAHNEAAHIAATIASVHAQTVPVDRVLVLADNCTDDTIRAARDAGAEAVATVGNTARKAGALNQGLGHVSTDLVLAMDADTELAPTWVASAMTDMTDGVGGVGAIFHADTDAGWLRGCQAREWLRYAEQADRTGKTFVLSGTAALLRVDALADVGGWDETSITEDFALTVALRGAGWDVRSPQGCAVSTETMSTVPALFRQRRRWSLGAVQTVTRAGLHRHTHVYWWQQTMLLLGVIAMAAVIGFTTAAAVGGWLSWSWVGTVILAAFVTERIVTAWPGGWRHRAVAALVAPELVYALILQAAHVAALVDAARGSAGSWHHATTNH